MSFFDAFELGLDGSQLDAAILCHRGDPGGQAAGQPDEHVLDGRYAEVLGRKDFRMVRFERELGLVLLFRPQTVKPFDAGLAVGAVLPLAGGPPGEFRRFGRTSQRLTRGEQRVDIDAVVDSRLCHR
jgi:hypothetical protein